MSKLQNDLVEAAGNGDIAKIQEYLAAGADRNGWNGNGWTPLCLAVYCGKTETVDYLLHYGARIDIPSNGKTALQYAKEGEKNYLIALLEKAEIARLAEETPEWSLFGASKLAHVEISPVLGRKLTEIFNFESRERMVVFENLKTGAEKIMPLESFNTLDEELIKKTFAIFTSLGGKADEGLVFKRSILKKSSPLSNPG